MQTTPIPESNRVMETIALRTLAFMLAPVLFTSLFAVVLASLPATALRWALSRA